MCFAKRFFSVCVISATKALKRFDFIRIDVEHPQARNCPETFFARDKSQATIDVAGQSAVIGINCESRLLDMNVPVYRRYTNEDQQIDHPGDRGFEFVSAIQETTIYWGRVPNSQNNV